MIGEEAEDTAEQMMEEQNWFLMVLKQTTKTKIAGKISRRDF